MGFYKKILVLKERAEGYSVSGRPLTGIVRIESEDGEAEVSLSLLNFAAVSEGEFHLSIVDCEGELFDFPIGSSPDGFSKKISPSPKADMGFAAVITYVNGEKAVHLAYAVSSSIDLKAEDVFEKIRRKLTDGEKKGANLPLPAYFYDDETVATENYYLYDEGKENAKLLAQNAGFEIQNKGEKAGETGEEQGIQDEVSATFKELPEGNYYDKVKEEMDRLFAEYPREEKLQQCLPQAYFVKIKYAGEKYYVAGLIKENDKPKYICYGVPARYSENPPEALRGYAGFLPLSLFDLKGEGYWMMYQDAYTGKCVHINE